MKLLKIRMQPKEVLTLVLGNNMPDAAMNDETPEN
jgi:hypothetical protein